VIEQLYVLVSVTGGVWHIADDAFCVIPYDAVTFLFEGLGVWV
jgi:hypothetical protein